MGVASYIDRTNKSRECTTFSGIVSVESHKTARMNIVRRQQNSKNFVILLCRLRRFSLPLRDSQEYPFVAGLADSRTCGKEADKTNGTDTLSIEYERESIRKYFIDFIFNLPCQIFGVLYRCIATYRLPLNVWRYAWFYRDVNDQRQ